MQNTTEQIIKKEKFKGRLRSKKPKSLIKKDGKDDLDVFFLALALIYNDMKDIVLFQVLLNERYEAAGPKIDVHDGEFAGINIHIIRIFSGLIEEFLNFLNKNNAVVESKEFLDLLNELPEEAKKIWQYLIDISNMKKGPENPTNYALMRIRGNITYHYEDAGKNLRIGFIERFHNKNKDKILKNDAAYYSLEDEMETTRFYYADAAAEEYMKEVSDGWDDYRNDINALVDTMNQSFYWLMKV